MRSFSPAHIRYLIERRLFGAAEIETVADERIVVCEAEPFDIAPSVYLPHHLDFVRRLHPETLQENENLRVRGGRGSHDPTIAYRIKGVRFRDSGLYKGKWARYFPPIKPQGNDPARVVGGGSYALASSYSGIKYFGHWVRDDTATCLMAETFAQPFCVRTPRWPHQPRYQQFFDLPWPVIDRADFDELYVFSDYAQNSHKVARYREIRRRLRRNAPPGSPSRRVYLHRGATGAVKRLMSNENEVLQALSKNGFVIVDVSRDSADDIVAALLDAETLVSIEGSHASPGVHTLAEGGGYLAIVPPAVFNNVAKDWTSALGMTYGFVVGEERGKAFHVNVRDLLTAVDALEAARR